MADTTAPPASTPSGNGEKIWNWFLEYCVRNPFFVLWNLALISGGLITLVHFVSIGYFPDLDIKTASSFLMGIALLGLFLVLLLSIMLVIPSYLIRAQVWNPYCLHKPAIPGAPVVRVSKEIEKRRQLPFAFLSILYGAIAFFAWIFVFSFSLPDSSVGYRHTVRTVTAVGVVVCVVLLFVLRYIGVRQTKQRGVSVDSLFGHSYLAQHFQLLFIWLIVYPGYLLLLALAANKLHADDGGAHAALVAFAFALAFANTSLAVVSLDSPKSYWFFPFICVFLIFVYLSIPTNTFSLTRSVFSSLGIGDIDNTKFIVKKSTCDAVNLLVPGSCKIASDAAGCIRPQNLANRIGNDYLLTLEMAGAKVATTPNEWHANSHKKIVIPVPKSEVLAWGVVPGGGPSEDACGAPGGTGVQK
jgi:hypothetical protein